MKVRVIYMLVHINNICMHIQIRYMCIYKNAIIVHMLIVQCTCALHAILKWSMHLIHTIYGYPLLVPMN